MQLKSYGEFNLIRRIRDRISGTHPDVVIGIGDDTAALRPTPGTLMLATTDTFVESLDFDLDFSTWDHIGWKSMAANLSDVAAMGGVPRYALVTLCMPEERSVEDVDAFYDGLMRLATRFDVRIIGGDISGMPGPATVSITVLGETPEARMVRRSGAQAGDLICVTGDLGASEAGLRLLQAARQRKKTAWMDLFEKTITKHRLPLPRVREAQLLAASGAVHAMIDISDGLSADALHMGEDSGVGLSLDARRWPIDAQTRAAARKLHLNPVELALNSGEEFELLCAVAPDAAPDLCRRTMDATGTPLTIIGEARTEAYGFSWQDETGTHPLISGGYDHFSGS